MSNATHKLERDSEKKGKKMAEKIAKDFGYMGECKCGGPLSIYLNSKPENRFNCYCMQCGSVSDVRFPKEGDEYVEDVNISLEQKALDLIKVVALLHSKTTYFKEVTKDKYKEIYETTY